MTIQTELNRFHDRCDAACGSQAFVLVELKTGTLVFCGHHYAKFETALKEVALNVLDNREQINESASISANAL